MARTKVIEIEPLTRVEGHGKVSIHLDDHNNVKEARLHIVEFRGFERFIKGRPFWEVPVIVQRLCGICPVSHQLASTKALDLIVGAKKVTPTAEKMRRLMNYGQIMQSHVLHFFHLCSPDLLFGFDADPKIRNIFEVIKKMPDLAVQGVMMRKYGQEIIKATAGKKIHGTGSVPGGVNKNLSIKERDTFLKDIEKMKQWALDALKLAKNYTFDHIDTLDLYHGNLRAIDASGNIIFDQVDYQNYDDYIMEEVRTWSYNKFPFIKSRGHIDGWYRVGPLSRMNTAGFIDTPEAQNALEEFKGLTNGKPNHMSLAYHWARMIETVYCVEKFEELLNDPDLQGTDLLVKGDRAEEGIGLIEAPRGTLFHHYRVNEDDQITYCNLIVSSTNNNEAMNRAVKKVAHDHISGKPEITEGMLNHVEVAVRSYDPCLSCATHALGQMPLVIEMFDSDGALLQRKSKNV
jgi:NAD-reducing hydrogenase large subunit